MPAAKRQLQTNNSVMVDLGAVSKIFRFSVRPLTVRVLARFERWGVVSSLAHCLITVE